MATLTIEIKKGKGKPHLVSFLICSGKTKKRLGTGIYLSDSEVSPNFKKIKNLAKARMIEVKRLELQDRLDQLLLATLGKHHEMTAAEIAERISTNVDDLDFFEFADDWLKHCNLKGKKNYETMLKSLERFMCIRKLPFSRITYSLLEGYEDFLRRTPRARTLYLGEFRHLYREAMRRYNTDLDQPIANDPFMRYRVPKQVLKKGVRALSQEQLMKVLEVECRPHSRAELAKECFMLSFCLLGMNSVDLYNAADYKRGFIRYCRTKTKERRSDNAYIEVKVHPVIDKLMRKYKGKRRVFNFCERYDSPDDFNRALNIGLKEVGASAGINNLTFYQARHTFASLSRNLMRFSKGDVDEALNHVGSYALADVYIQKDFSIINDNNFKLLDTLFPENP